MGNKLEVLEDKVEREKSDVPREIVTDSDGEEWLIKAPTVDESMNIDAEEASRQTQSEASAKQIARCLYDPDNPNSRLLDPNERSTAKAENGKKGYGILLELPGTIDGFFMNLLNATNRVLGASSLSQKAQIGRDALDAARGALDEFDQAIVSHEGDVDQIKSEAREFASALREKVDAAIERIEGEGNGPKPNSDG